MIELELMRKKIDEIDDKLLVLFKERLEVSKKIGLLKKKHNMKIFDPQREQYVRSSKKAQKAKNELRKLLG